MAYRIIEGYRNGEVIGTDRTKGRQVGPKERMEREGLVFVPAGTGCEQQNDFAVHLYGVPSDTCKGRFYMAELTYGQKAVGLKFNPSGSDEVGKAKQTCADAIDQMNEFRNLADSAEKKALATIAIRKLQSAQMDMVKALTWED